MWTQKRACLPRVNVYDLGHNYRFPIDAHPLKSAPTSRNGVSLPTTHLTGGSSKNLVAFSLTATYCVSSKCQEEAVCFPWLFHVFMCDIPMLVHIYPCILKESPRSTLVSLLFSTLIFEIKSLTEPRVNQLASKAPESSCLCLRLKLHACTSVLGFYVCLFLFFLIGSGHLNSKHFTP